MMQLEYVKDMPQPARELRLDFSSLLGPLFFTWVIQSLFPVSAFHNMELFLLSHLITIR